MAFLIAAPVLFTAMHFLPFGREGGVRCWELWKEIEQVALRPRHLGEWPTGIAVSSFVTFSLLIVTSPFLGKVWVKSLFAWSMVVICSGVVAAGFWLAIFKHSSAGQVDLGGWCLIISPVLNFVGLLLARPQWLKKSGLPFPPESQSAV